MTYYLINYSEINLVNFQELGSCDENQQTIDYLRISIDGTQCILTWYNEENQEQPSFLSLLSFYETYINEEIFTVLAGPNWTK